MKTQFYILPFGKLLKLNIYIFIAKPCVCGKIKGGGLNNATSIDPVGRADFADFVLMSGPGNIFTRFTCFLPEIHVFTGLEMGG